MEKKFRKMIRPLVVLSLFFGVLVSGAVGAENVRYGGTLTYLDQSPSLSPMSWDNEDIIWKHTYDNGFFKEPLIMGDLQKGPRGTKEFTFQTTAWIPEKFLKWQTLEKWEVKQNPLRVIFYLRKGIFWQDKPGVMKAREFTADDVVYSMTRLRNSRKALDRYDFMDRWEIVDKYTVVMDMKEWTVEWAYRIAWGYYSGTQAPEQEKAPGGPKWSWPIWPGSG